MTGCPGTAVGAGGGTVATGDGVVVTGDVALVPGTGALVAGTCGGAGGEGTGAFCANACPINSDAQAASPAAIGLGRSARVTIVNPPIRCLAVRRRRGGSGSKDARIGAHICWSHSN